MTENCYSNDRFAYRVKVVRCQAYALVDRSGFQSLADLTLAVDQKFEKRLAESKAIEKWQIIRLESVINVNFYCKIYLTFLFTQDLRPRGQKPGFLVDLSLRNR